METRHRILEINNSPKFTLLKDFLDKTGRSYKLTLTGQIGGKDNYLLEYCIAENDSQFPQVQDWIEKYHFYEQVSVYYSEQDIASAQWFSVTAGEYQYPQPEDIFGFRNATYDISDHCFRCGMGSEQNNPFHLKYDFRQKNDQFLGLHWVFDEIFIRSIVKNTLEAEGFTNIEYIHPVLHKTGEEIEEVFQIKTSAILSPGLITDGLETVTCKKENEESHFEGFNRKDGNMPFCGRVKYHYPRRDDIKFKKESFIGVPDILKSFEYFGSGAQAQRLILVSKRFYEIIKLKQFQGLFFKPINLV